MKKAEYTKHIVTYFDILGFKDKLTGDNKKRASEIVNLLNEFKNTSKTLYQYRDENIQSQTRYFSDMIIRAIPYEESNKKAMYKSIYKALFRVSLLHSYFINKKILIRGAMEVGDFFINRDLLFGEAFNTVVELEKNEAEYPVIIIGPKLKRLVIEESPNHINCDEVGDLKRLISNHNHSYYYVDYFNEILSNVLSIDTQELTRQDKAVLNDLESHKRVIEECLVKYYGVKRVYSKYVWLRDYHNYTIDRRNNVRLQKYKIY